MSFCVLVCVLVWDWWELCVQSTTCSNTERARKRGNKSHMMCTSANTQLDSLLYPRDERSATWAFPRCDLAPFGEWIMYTCTHFPQQYTRSTSNSLPHSYTVQPAKHRVYICQLALVFRFLANSPLHTGTGFSTTARFPSWIGDSVIWAA